MVKNGYEDAKGGEAVVPKRSRGLSLRSKPPKPNSGRLRGFPKFLETHIPLFFFFFSFQD